MAKWKRRPLDDRVVVKPIEAEETTAGGIVLPDSAKEKPKEKTEPGKIRSPTTAAILRAIMSFKKNVTLKRERKSISKPIPPLIFSLIELFISPLNQYTSFSHRSIVGSNAKSNRQAPFALTRQQRLLFLTGNLGLFNLSPKTFSHPNRIFNPAMTENHKLFTTIASHDITMSSIIQQKVSNRKQHFVTRRMTMGIIIIFEIINIDHNYGEIPGVAFNPLKLFP